MPSRTPSLLSAAFAASLFLTVLLAPLLAQAEEHDASEWGHGIAVLGLLFMIFLGCFSVAVWLLIARIRSSAAEASAQTAPVRPNLERLWFPRRQQP